MRAERADLGVRAGRIADVEPAGAVAERREELLGHRRDADQAADRGRVATAGRERGPQRRADHVLDRRARQHEHRALRRRCGNGHNAGAGARQRGGGLVAVRDEQQLLGDPGAHEDRPQPLAGQRRGRHEDGPVAGQERGGDLERRLGPGRRRAAEDPDHPARLLHADRAPAGAQERRAPEPAVGQRARAVVRQRAQSRDRGEELAEHGLRPRPPRLAREEQRELVEVVEQDPRRPPYVPRSRGSGHRRPDRLRARRPARRLADGRGRRRLDRAQPLAGRGRV